MKNTWITLILFAILFLGGLLIGWFWCKSTFKPVIIEKPGETIVTTQWKTNTVMVQKPIQHYVQVIKWKDKPVYVYGLIDTSITNIYQYQNFLQTQGSDSKDIISFNIETVDQIKTYADTTYNNSYLQYRQNLRVTNFVYKPSPNQIKPKQITSKFQMYGNVMLTMTQEQSNNIINNKYTFTPYIGISGVVGQRFKLDFGASLNSFYGGAGIKFLDWK